MADRNKLPAEYQKVGWLDKYVEEEDTSLQAMREYVIIPRLKVCQGQTKSELKELCGGEGGVLIPSELTKVCEKEEAFQIVPLYFYSDYAKRSDFNSTLNEPMYVEQSNDPASELAVKAKNVNLRTEPYPDDPTLKYRYCERLNFIFVIYDGENKGKQVAYSFTIGEFQNGRRFISQIASRAPVHSYFQVWEVSTSIRSDQKGRNWWGCDFRIPENSLISEEEAPIFANMHKELHKSYKDRTVVLESEDKNDTGSENFEGTDF